jgi:hypothetical protein
MKQLSPDAGSSGDCIAKSRESCYMIIGESAVPGIVKALEEAEAFSSTHHSITLSHPTFKAFTYLPPAKD